jgi:hypothetical protein
LIRPAGRQQTLPECQERLLPTQSYVQSGKQGNTAAINNIVFSVIMLLGSLPERVLRKRDAWSGFLLPRSWKQRKQLKALTKHARMVFFCPTSTQ